MRFVHQGSGRVRTTEPLQLRTSLRAGDYSGHHGQRPPPDDSPGWVMDKGFEAKPTCSSDGVRPSSGPSADLYVVDITDIPHVLGEVVLMGPQGDEELTAYELASWAGTIPYEIPCAISDRVSRSYVETFA